MSSGVDEQLGDQQRGAYDVDDGGSKPDGDENEDEDEEEDVDFNPFLKGTPSPEASSSLSSEVEGLDGNSPKPIGEVKNYAVGDSEHGEEIVMQTAFCSGSEKELCHGKMKKRKSDSGFQMDDGSVQEKDNSSSKPVINVDDEDAICKRTRARYSLASFTLDELETFLQETDDEDDLHNFDDEEEYRKFLAAVLNGDGESTQENENVDDEDEDNDADFELELEELLESDVDVTLPDKDKKPEYERARRRPETRQNRRQKASAQYRKKLLEQTKRPLRPLIPVLPNAVVAPFPTMKALAPETSPSYSSSTAEYCLINGFTSQQIGQLHCLIHEHVQLLIQVFSLCILDPSRQHIASQVQGLIFEMVGKRDEAIACRSMPYPSICFRPQHMCLVTDEIPNFQLTECNHESSNTVNTQISVSKSISPPKGRHGHFPSGQVGSSQTAASSWVPLINGPVVSILDAAPLDLVRKYMDDVYNAVREYRQRHLESSYDSLNEKEPLFHLPCFPSAAEANDEVVRGNISTAPNTVPSGSLQRPPKKTMAASMVENAKKQSVALVPKDISKLANRFFPLFNPALFPHKPPPVAVANRVLFTDAEDELLALGMMEYNTDWKAIQQRFLPCKSEHQIFVRQKNRCSSKAPENPIKAVRRMKTSPLTTEEVERIQEGLRVFKLDWMSVWKFVVPYRDPSLLPRQWRIALGTQKSYKLDDAKKEKRRIYESKRRKRITAELANWQLAPQKEGNQPDNAGGEHNIGDDYVDNADEAYVHRAFLSDWRPGTTSVISYLHPCSNHREKDIPSDATHIKEQANGYDPREMQSQSDNMHGFPLASRYYHYPHTISHVTTGSPCPSNTAQQNLQVSNMELSTQKSQISLLPYRTRRTDGAHLVKLAPELPPVNLPPSARVMSQAVFKSNQCGVSIKECHTGGGIGDVSKENSVLQLQHAANLRTTNLVKIKRDETIKVTDNSTTSCTEESAVAHDTCMVEERGADADLQMHPLLFQPPEDECLPYFPVSCSNDPSFGFFSGNHPQLKLSLFHNPHRPNQVNCFNKSSKAKESTSASCGIDFHPLLQRIDEGNSNLVTVSSNKHHFVSLGSKSAQFQNTSDVMQSISQGNVGPSATGPKPSSPYGKANELDLEIHLSSTSAKEKTRGSSSGDAYDQPMPTTSAPTSVNRTEICETNSPCHQNGKGNRISDAQASGPGSNNNRCDVDGVGDQSHPEIVMEQEELSDSDEEIEEHVEFEHEEMDDSDGEEGSGCEPITERQDKEASSGVMEKFGPDMDDGDQQCEVRTVVQPQGSTSDSGNSCTLLNLSLTRLGRDTTGNSWLSLVSCASVDPPSMKAQCEKGANLEDSAAKNLVSSRPNRSCKKTVPSSKKSATTHCDVMDMAQQLSLGPLAVSTLRKPRKRASRMNTSLIMETTAEHSKSDKDRIG